MKCINTWKTLRELGSCLFSTQNTERSHIDYLWWQSNRALGELWEQTKALRSTETSLGSPSSQLLTPESEATLFYSNPWFFLSQSRNCFYGYFKPQWAITQLEADTGHKYAVLSSMFFRGTSLNKQTNHRKPSCLICKVREVTQLPPANRAVECENKEIILANKY